MSDEFWIWRERRCAGEEAEALSGRLVAELQLRRLYETELVII